MNGLTVKKSRIIKTAGTVITDFKIKLKRNVKPCFVRHGVTAEVLFLLFVVSAPELG